MLWNGVTRDLGDGRVAADLAGVAAALCPSKDFSLCAALLLSSASRPELLGMVLRVVVVRGENNCFVNGLLVFSGLDAAIG